MHPLHDLSAPAPPMRDGIGFRTNVTFGLRDRLRILLGWEVRVEASVRTERRIGQLQVEPSNVNLLRPTWLFRWGRHKGDELFYVGPTAASEDV